jgi:hypothetical protein
MASFLCSCVCTAANLKDHPLLLPQGPVEQAFVNDYSFVFAEAKTGCIYKRPQQLQTNSNSVVVT